MSWLPVLVLVGCFMGVPHASAQDASRRRAETLEAMPSETVASRLASSEWRQPVVHEMRRSIRILAVSQTTLGAGLLVFGGVTLARSPQGRLLGAARTGVAGGSVELALALAQWLSSRKLSDPKVIAAMQKALEMQKPWMRAVRGLFIGSFALGAVLLGALGPDTPWTGMGIGAMANVAGVSLHASVHTRLAARRLRPYALGVAW